MVELIKTTEKVCHLDVLGERHDPVFIKCSNKFRINFVLRIVQPSSLIHLLPICPSFVGHPSPHIVFHILICQLCHYCICILQPMIQTLLHLIIHHKLSNCFTVSICFQFQEGPYMESPNDAEKSTHNQSSTCGELYVSKSERWTGLVSLHNFYNLQGLKNQGKFARVIKMWEVTSKKMAHS